MPRSDWAAWVQAVGSIAAIFGAAGVAIWQAHRQHKNSLDLVRSERQHFAYAVFVQVAEHSAQFEYMTHKLVELGPQIALPNLAKSNEFEPTDFWCSVVGEFLRSNKEMGETLAGFSLDGMSNFLTTALSALQIQGREIAGLPKEVIAAHHRASTALSRAKDALDGVAAMVKNDRTKLRDDAIGHTWAEMQRMGKSLIEYREKLKATACASTDEFAALERNAMQTAEREQVEGIRRLQAVPAAAAAARSFLARQQADESVQRGT
jgi:phosphoribosylcarboxyaminoimidazole (NCAIR) mutase